MMSSEKHHQPDCWCSPLPLHMRAAVRAHQLSLEQAYTVLSAITERFEGYEPHTQEDCEKAETALVFANKALKDHDLFHPIDVFDAPAHASLLSALDHLDEARMYLSAYRPSCGSRELAHLRLRKVLSTRLTETTGAIRNVIARMRCMIGDTPPLSQEERP